MFDTTLIGLSNAWLDGMRTFDADKLKPITTSSFSYDATDENNNVKIVSQTEYMQLMTDQVKSLHTGMDVGLLFASYPFFSSLKWCSL